MPVEIEARGTDRYRVLVRQPYVKAMFGWAIVARLPLGMTTLALVLLVRSTGGSYGAAGLVAAVYAISVAVGAPYAGRQVDRRGGARVLRRRLLIFPVLMCVVAFLGAVDAPVWALVLPVALAGVSLAPISSTMRSIWPAVLGEDTARTAYALEAALQEVIFVGGPMLVALLVIISPVAGVVGAAVACAVGTFAFVRLKPVREAGPAETHHGARLGALSSPGVRTIALMAVFMGCAFGAVEIATPAFAELEGNRALAGIALAGFSAGSLIGGLISGLRPSQDERRRMLIGAIVLVAALALPLLAESIATLTVLLFVAGLPIAPMVAATYGLIGRVAAPGSIAEAFAWFGTAVSTGLAFGSIAGGWLVDQHGWRATIIFSVALAAVAAAVLAARQGSLGEAHWIGEPA